MKLRTGGVIIGCLEIQLIGYHAFNAFWCFDFQPVLSSCRPCVTSIFIFAMANIVLFIPLYSFEVGSYTRGQGQMDGLAVCFRQFFSSSPRLFNKPVFAFLACVWSKSLLISSVILQVATYPLIRKSSWTIWWNANIYFNYWWSGFSSLISLIFSLGINALLFPSIGTISFWKKAVELINVICDGET